MNKVIRKALVPLVAVVASSLAVPAASAAEPSAGPGASHQCRTGFLCLYDQIGFKGNVWERSKCGFYNIGLEGWSDRVRSYRNNQTGGVQSIFMQWSGERWEELGRANAGQEDEDATQIYATDGVWVC